MASRQAGKQATLCSRVAALPGCSAAPRNRRTHLPQVPHPQLYHLALRVPLHLELYFALDLLPQQLLVLENTHEGHRGDAAAQGHIALETYTLNISPVLIEKPGRNHSMSSRLDILPD